MELAIISKDNFPLLNRMREDLIKNGYVDDVEWNGWMLKGAIKTPIICMNVHEDNELTFYSYDDRMDDEEQIHLTPDNYDTILNRCIDNLKK